MFKASHLTVAYKDQPIITDLSMTIEKGTIHVLLGPNGSGKSTFASAVVGMPSYAVISGSLSFENHNLLQMLPEQRARLGIFFVSQQPPAIPGLPVVTFLKEVHRMLTDELYTVQDFKDHIYRLCDKVGLDHSFLYRSVHEGFSGGEKKRFELLQLLLCKPKFAVLDEIDSGLDIDGLKNLSQLLAQEQRDRSLSLLLITHYPKILEYLKPDWVHLLSNGKIVRSDDYRLAEEVFQKGYDGLCL